MRLVADHVAHQRALVVVAFFERRELQAIAAVGERHELRLEVARHAGAVN